MAANIEYTEEMLAKANTAFAKLNDKAESLTVADLAPVVTALLAELNLPQSDAAGAFEHMEKSTPSEKKEWSSSKNRGAFIVFEGLDRAGKSTQSKELLATMNKETITVERDANGEALAKRKQAGLGPKWMCFPARHTPIGSLIDQYLRKKVEMCDRAVHLLFSANRWEMASTILEDLEAGRSVICDRYGFSGVVYSAAKGMDPEWCRSSDIGLPQPDLIFFLYLDPEVGAKRAAFGDERYENKDMQTAVREQFAAADFGSGEKRVNWNAVDGGQEKAVISEQIKKTVNDYFSASQENPMPALKSLWV